jgi:hypothetical protein
MCGSSYLAIALAWSRRLPRHRGTAVMIVLVTLLLLVTSSCKELFGGGQCCCFPTLSTKANDGKIEDPSSCSNPDYYCAGNSTDNSVDDRRAYSQHCGASSSLDKLDDHLSFTSHAGLALPSLGFHAHIDSTGHATPQTSGRSQHQDPAQCDSECANNGPFCLKVNLDNQGAMISKVEKARKLIMDSTPGHIKKSQFMQIFDLNTDPCRRKDTILSTNEISNEGQSCFLNSSIYDGNGTFGFVVHLPTTIQGTRSVASENVTLTFDDPVKSPSLTIGDFDLNRDFGGSVQRVTANGESGVISTSRGCIAIRTQSTH